MIQEHSFCYSNKMKHIASNRSVHASSLADSLCFLAHILLGETWSFQDNPLHMNDWFSYVPEAIKAKGRLSGFLASIP